MNIKTFQGDKECVNSRRFQNLYLAGLASDCDFKKSPLSNTIADLLFSHLWFVFHAINHWSKSEVDIMTLNR